MLGLALLLVLTAAYIHALEEEPEMAAQHSDRSPFALAAALGAGVVLGCSLGFMLIEHWGFLDSLYMTIITLSTVGYGEVHPLSNRGKLFVVFVIITGIGAATYSLSTMLRLVVEGELKRRGERRKMRKKIAKMDGHTIVCGFGQLGTIVVRGLLDAGQPVIVIDHDSAKITSLEEDGIPYVEGAAYKDEVLKAAGISSAKALITLLPNVADSVYVTLCARDLNPNLWIIARIDDESGEKNLRRAGANHVLAPYRVAGSRLIQQMLRPNVSDFLELAADKSSAGLAIEEVVISEDSSLVGKTLEEADLRRKTGAVVAALIHQNGKTVVSPGSADILDAGTTMIVIGEKPSLGRLSELL